MVTVALGALPEALWWLTTTLLLIPPMPCCGDHACRQTQPPKYSSSVTVVEWCSALMPTEVNSSPTLREVATCSLRSQAKSS